MKRSTLLMCALLAGGLLVGGARAGLPSAGAEIHTNSDSTSNSAIMSVMLAPVAGQPYEARKVTRSIWLLADGTTITHESATKEARDGQGRVREEIEQTRSASIGGTQTNHTSESVTIADPVDHSILMLFPSPLKMAMRMQMPDIGGLAKKAGGIGGILGGAPPPPPSPGVVGMAGMTTGPNAVVGTPGGIPPAMLRGGVNLGTSKACDGCMAAAGPLKISDDVRTEELGTDIISGVTVRGKRTTTTIRAGEIGNDRPIVITHEEWYSQQMKLVVKSEDNDPRSGKRTMELEGLIGGEPDAALFKVPEGYKVQDAGDLIKSIGSIGHTAPAKQ